MAAREQDTQIGQTSQLSENRGGLPSFGRELSASDVAKGSQVGQLSEDDFGTLGQSDRRRAQTAELNQQMQMNRKRERAVRIGYRNMIKKGDGAGALRLLSDAESQGISPFGIKVEGQRANEASSRIQGRRSTEVRAGVRDFEPNRDFFQSGLQEVESPQLPQVAAEGDQNSTRDLDELLAVLKPEGQDPKRVAGVSRRGVSSVVSPEVASAFSGALDNIARDEAEAKSIMDNLKKQNSILARGTAPNLSSFL